MYKDIRNMLKQELKKYDLYIIERGISDLGKYTLYQDNQIFEGFTIGLLILDSELRVVMYDNLYNLDEEHVVFRDFFRFNYMYELISYGNSMETIVNEIFEMLKDERGVYLDGKIQTREE